MSQSCVQVPIEIQRCIVQWIGLIPKRSFVHYQKCIENINDIVNSNFYLNILATVQNFKLIERVNPQSELDDTNSQLSLWIDNMKKIGKSILAYYQTVKLANISNMNFNFVSQCMGNKQEIIHFFLLTLGVLVDSQNHQRYFENLEGRMSQTGYMYFKQCLQNSKRMGGQDCILSNKSFVKDGSNSKKLLNRLQQLQENQDILEDQNKRLRDEVSELKQLNQKLCDKIEELQKDLLSLSQRKSQYQDQFDQLSRSKSMMDRTEQALRIKISQLQTQLLEKDRRYKQKAIKVQELTSKAQIHHNKYIEIKSINEDLRKLLEVQKSKALKHTQKLEQLKQQNRKLHQQKEQLQTYKLHAQIQLSKYRKATEQSDYKLKNKHPNCSAFQIQESWSDNENQNNKYRNKENLANALNSSRLMGQSQKVNNQFTLAKQFHAQNRKLIDNFSIFDRSKFRANQQAHLCQRKTNSKPNKQQMEEYVNYLYKLNSQHNSQVMLLVQMIYDLQNQLSRQRSHQKEQKQIKQRRKQQFKSKVSEIFGQN